jgi:methylenetetrahydrofolate dehydrogenase (NADP+)/methenyltetrahydrofolate cyclohydrolase
VTATLLNGNVVLDAVKVDLRARIDRLGEQGVTVGLGTVLVGDDPGSAKYVQMKRENCAELGIASIHTQLPADTTQAEIDAVVDRYNADPAVHAYLMQHPFPKGLNFEDALLRVDPDKDVDGLHPVNLGKLVQGVAGPRSCTPAGIQALLAHYEVPIAGRHVVIVGRGLTVGKALANLLSLKEPNANAAVTLVHTGVPDITPFTRQADILVVAAGSPGLVTADMVRPGAAVVQTGAAFVNGKIAPDVDPAVEGVAGWFAKATGSVGPMTRAMLLTNVVEAAERSVSRRRPA